MTSPDALAILDLPEHERIAAVADLLRERNSLCAALKSAQAEIEMHDRSAQRAARIDRMEPTDGDRKWAVVAHVELVRHLAQLLILSMETAGAINYTEHTVTGTLDVGEIRITATTLLPGGRTPDKLREQAAMERDEASAERDRLLSILRDVSEALSGGEVPAEDLARADLRAEVKRLTAERDFYCDRAFHLLDNHLHGADRDAEYSRLERGPEVSRG